MISFFEKVPTENLFIDYYESLLHTKLLPYQKILLHRILYRHLVMFPRNSRTEKSLILSGYCDFIKDKIIDKSRVYNISPVFLQEIKRDYIKIDENTQINWR